MVVLRRVNALVPGDTFRDPRQAGVPRLYTVMSKVQVVNRPKRLTVWLRSKDGATHLMCCPVNIFVEVETPDAVPTPRT